ncbi:hypothetical protein WMY93_026098 [Mugilogobius chulae]|uniref:IF rod domain-containing protein n=1 Tax=Mugilogobius chulae TaxID=88201 RepID=A0AAW0N376_9GOBI
MSRSPERISSYRRHFEEGVSSSYQVRVSSPSPIRREGRTGSAAEFSGRVGAGVVRMESAGRAMSAARRSRTSGAGLGAGALVCVGPTGHPPMDLDAAAVENQEFKNTRTSERQEMIVLNDRLAVYIDKVRSLEQQNKLLEAEIEAYQNRFVKPSGLRQLYEEQLRELKKIADQIKAQRDIAFAAKDSTAVQLSAMKLKYEEAIELRRKAEAEIEAFRPDVDQATSSRIALEKRYEQLEVEIEFLKRVHQQEIEELMKQIYAAHVSAESAFSLPDLAGALKQIQNQYDDIAAKICRKWILGIKTSLKTSPKRHLGMWIMFETIEKGLGMPKKMKCFWLKIQNKERDLEALKTKNEALEAKIREMQEKFRKEIEELQARIESLQIELKTTKEKIALHLREYQDLLNIKMSLEIEITTYRKLIEGEDLRLAGMMQTLSLSSCSITAIHSERSFSEGSIGGVGGNGGGGVGVVGVNSGGYGGGAGIGGDLNMGDSNMAGGKTGVVGGVSTGDIGLSSGSVVTESSGFGSAIAGLTDAGAIPGGIGAAGSGDISLGVGGLGRGHEGPEKVATGAKLEGGGGSISLTDAGHGISGLGGPGSNLVRTKNVDGAMTEGSEIAPEGAYHDVSIGAAGIRTDDLKSGREGSLGTIEAGLKDKATGSRGPHSGADKGTAKGAGIGLGAGAMDKKFGMSSEGRGIGPGGLYTGVIGADNFTVAEAGSDVGLVEGSTDFRVSQSGALGDAGGEGLTFDDSKVGGTGSAEAAGQSIGGDRAVVSELGCGDIALKGFDGTKGLAAVKGSSGSGVGFGSDQFGSNIEPYAEQAVEVTERRTVLIRTVKHANEVLEMDHQEQTYTISGAADSDNE